MIFSFHERSLIVGGACKGTDSKFPIPVPVVWSRVRAAAFMMPVAVVPGPVC